MPNPTKPAFLAELTRRYGALHKLNKSLSLFEIGHGAARIYIRYSKVHNRKDTFYGLRKEDLQQLEGFASYMCFLWDDQDSPLILPFSDYEEVFQSIVPASDGQYKAQVYLQDGTEFYLARAGRFNVEGYMGWGMLDDTINAAGSTAKPLLSHSQVQTLLGSIGTTKGYDIWVPVNDRGRLDWAITKPYECRNVLPYGFDSVKSILQEIDVIWFKRGSSEPQALFEVEHSTTIYSGLLRFNDIHLTVPNLHPRYSIVADDVRRVLF
ncbi:MAG: hypothetical protein NTZ05_22535, partial [Chloroflexi bacterium]|nr:hypothetical protein [Chloroflexota bacterium]